MGIKKQYICDTFYAIYYDLLYFLIFVAKRYFIAYFLQ